MVRAINILLIVILLSSCQSLSRTAQNDKIRVSNHGKVVEIWEDYNIMVVAFERSSVNGVKILTLDLSMFPNAYLGMPIYITDMQYFK